MNCFRELVVLACVLAGAGHAAAATWHVDPAATPGGDGSASQPFDRIRHATDVAGPGDTIELAAGVYTRSQALTIDGKARRAQIVLPDGVEIRGAGVGATVLEAQAAAVPVFGITAEGVGRSALVTDLTLAGASTQGVNLRGASPTLRNLAILTDVVGGSSLAMDVRDGSDPLVQDCVLDGGHSSLFIEFGSSGRYERLTLARRQNETLAITDSSPVLVDCVIEGAGRDTIVFNQAGSPQITGCTIGRGDRWTVRVFGFDPGSTVSMGGNRWFTSDPGALADAILDATDDPGLGATVEVEPLLPPVSVERASFGGLKAGFRP